MKTRRFDILGYASLAAPLILALSSSASAQLTWDPDNDQTNNGGNGTWDVATSASWWDGTAVTNTTWTNGEDAIFGDFAANYTVDIADGGVTVGDLTHESTNTLTFQSVTDNLGVITIASGGATWDTGGGIIAFNNFNDGSSLDVPLTIQAGDTLTVTGGGRFDTGEAPNGADWSGDVIAFPSATVVKGSGNTIGQIALTKLEAGSTYIHGRNSDQDYHLDWELTGTGKVIFGNRWNGRTMWLNGVISGTGGLTFSGLGTNLGNNNGLARLNDTANSFSGGITVDGSASNTLLLIAGGDSVLGTVPGAFEADHITLKDGGLIRFNGGIIDANRGITLENGGVINAGATTTIQAPITGGGGLTFGYSGGGGNTVNLNATSDYTGNTYIYKGNIILGADNGLSTSGLLTLGANSTTARLSLNGKSQTITGLANIGGGTKQLVNVNAATTGSTTGTLIVDVADGETYAAGSATGVNAADDRGNFNIIKNGLGIQELGTVQIGGDLTVNAGRLELGNNNGSCTVNGAVSVTGGTLLVDETLNGITSISVTGGAYRFSNDSYLGTVPVALTADYITLDGGTMNVSMETARGGSFEIDSNRGITLGAGGGTIQTTTPSGAWLVSYNGVISGTGTLTKASGQSLALGGDNTYTGATIINAGRLRLPGTLASEVTVQAGGSINAGDLDTGTGTGSMPALTFEDGSTMVSFITTTGVDATKAIVSGAVTIGTTANLIVVDQGGDVILANDTKLTLIDYTGGSLTGTFLDKPDGSSLVVGSNTFILDYDDGGNFVTLTADNDPYDIWSASYSLVGGFDDDDDYDGVENGMEFVLDGDPTVSDLEILPTVSRDASNLTFSYTRNPDSKTSTAQIVQWSVNLEDWTDIVVDPGDPDAVDVLIPLSNAVDGKLFSRLKTTQP